MSDKLSDADIIRIERALKRGYIPIDLYKIFLSMQEIECPVCHQRLPKVFFADIRGVKQCFRCHWDKMWDFMEETRRRTESFNRQVEEVKELNRRLSSLIRDIEIKRKRWEE